MLWEEGHWKRPMIGNHRTFSHGQIFSHGWRHKNLEPAVEKQRSYLLTELSINMSLRKADLPIIKFKHIPGEFSWCHHERLWKYRDDKMEIEVRPRDTQAQFKLTYRLAPLLIFHSLSQQNFKQNFPFLYIRICSTKLGHRSSGCSQCASLPLSIFNTFVLDTFLWRMISCPRKVPVAMQLICLGLRIMLAHISYMESPLPPPHSHTHTQQTPTLFVKRAVW